MPLYDEGGLPSRTLSARDQEQAAKERRAALGGFTAEDVQQKLKERSASALPGQTSDLSVFSDLLKSVMDTSPSPAQAALDGLVAGADPRAQMSGLPTSSAPAQDVGSIIGKRNYQVGRGNPQLRSMAQSVANFMGWGPDEFAAWDAVINAESGWNPNAQNPTSTAYGLGQFLNSTWKGYGPKTSDPATQLAYMARYIKNRYGSPSKALIFHNSHNWY